MGDLARNTKQIGAVIRRARKKLGITQKELGEKVGIWQVTVSLIENGESGARIDTLLSILAALDLEFQIVPRSRDLHADIERNF